jgi:uncharacterized membrane protein
MFLSKSVNQSNCKNREKSSMKNMMIGYFLGSLFLIPLMKSSFPLPDAFLSIAILIISIFAGIYYALETEKKE